MISYESSKWYVKLWRMRWYLYATLLYLTYYIDIEIWIDYFLGEKIEKKKKKELRSTWKDIIRHVELSKMYKFSTKSSNEREEN